MHVTKRQILNMQNSRRIIFFTNRDFAYYGNNGMHEKK